MVCAFMHSVYANVWSSDSCLTAQTSLLKTLQSEREGQGSAKSLLAKLMIQFDAIFWLRLPDYHTSAWLFDPSNFRNTTCTRHIFTKNWPLRVISPTAKGRRCSYHAHKIKIKLCVEKPDYDVSQTHSRWAELPLQQLLCSTEWNNN